MGITLTKMTTTQSGQRLTFNEIFMWSPGHGIIYPSLLSNVPPLKK